jgi:hypothetical protein
MRFRIWLENEPPETQEFDPNNPPDGPETIEYMPDNEEGWGIGTVRDFDNILAIMREIDPSIPNPEGGWQPETRKPNGSVDSDVFSGTPDYAAPEQFQAMTFKNSLDNYERVLLSNIPQIFPNAAQEAKELARIWSQFRNKVIHKSSVQEVAQARRPIHYAIPLQELHRVIIFAARPASVWQQFP